ncbi:MAG: dihydroneopterin aldolase [Pseudomonadota bacterium]
MAEPSWSLTNSHIFIRDLCLEVHIGVGAEERAKPQRLLIDLDLEVRPARAVENDVSTVVDYGTVLAAVQGLASRETQLLETWVGWIAGICFADTRVTAASITLTKPDVFAGSVQVGVRQRVARAELS